MEESLLLCLYSVSYLLSFRPFEISDMDVVVVVLCC